jgi:hypothetical protein
MYFGSVGPMAQRYLTQELLYFAMDLPSSGPVLEMTVSGRELRLSGNGEVDIAHFTLLKPSEVVRSLGIAPVNFISEVLRLVLADLLAARRSNSTPANWCPLQPDLQSPVRRLGT